MTPLEAILHELYTKLYAVHNKDVGLVKTNAALKEAETKIEALSTNQ